MNFEVFKSFQDLKFETLTAQSLQEQMKQMHMMKKEESQESNIPRGD